MTFTVSEVADLLERRGLLTRHPRDQGERLVAHVCERLARDLPDDLKAFYRANIRRIGAFDAIAPIWNDHVGWRPGAMDLTGLSHAGAVPVFWDGCGNVYGLDLLAVDQIPAVYFFDHELEYAEPRWAAGSSLGAFMLLLAEHDLAYKEGRPAGWELTIDPDIDKCPRAPAIWSAG